MDKLFLNLQQFAGEEDVDVIEGDEDLDAAFTGDESLDDFVDDPIQLTQAEIDKMITTRLSREQRKLGKIFGTNDLDSVAEYAKVGREIARTTGKKPSEILQKVSGMAGAQNMSGSGTGVVDESIREELNSIKQILSTTHETRVKEEQVVEVKKEFGVLFEQNKDAIEDYADEKGLSLVDAAAVVLRPKLKQFIESKIHDRQQLAQNRKLTSAGGKPNKDGADYASKLTPEMKRIAQKQNISFKDYYEYAKGSGLID